MRTLKMTWTPKEGRLLCRWVEPEQSEKSNAAWFATCAITAPVRPQFNPTYRSERNNRGSGKVTITSGELSAVRTGNVPTDLFILLDIRLGRRASSALRARELIPSLTGRRKITN